MSQMQRKRKARAYKRASSRKHFFAVAVICLIISIALAINAYPKRGTAFKEDFDWSEFDRKGLSLKAKVKVKELQSKYTLDQAKQFLEQIVLPTLDRGMERDPIQATRRLLEELHRARKSEKVKISIYPGFFKVAEDLFVIGVVARSVPKFMSNVGADEIELSLANLEQYRNDDRKLADVLISYFCHEWLHISTDKSFKSYEASKAFIKLATTEEARIWREQVVIQLIPMRQSGRFLTIKQQKVINHYDNLTPDQWDEWAIKEFDPTVRLPAD